MRDKCSIMRFWMPLLSLLIIASCVEELDLDSLSSNEGLGPLVVEATFTDQTKRQLLYLSRAETRLDLITDTTYIPYLPLGRGSRDSVNVETNAQVRLIGPDGNIQTFFESEPGTYLSTQEFGLQLNSKYLLEINTYNGTEYISSPLEITASAQLTDVVARRFTEDDGTSGIAIFASGRPLSGDASKIRYTYEETYKIIAPKWNSQDFKLSNYDPCALPQPTFDLEIIDREVNNRICYNTVQSNRILQLNTINEAGREINDFKLRFIEQNNFIISHRYSILVRQYVQSPGAFSFYNALKNYSDEQDVFSQIQPGALRANLKRADGSDEIVLGYIEAASVSEKRIFFDYEDFFPATEQPSYPFLCADDSSPLSHISYCSRDPHGADPCPSSIIERVNLKLIAYTGDNDSGIGTCPGPYTYVPIVCGDCTLLGDIEVPDFWID